MPDIFNPQVVSIIPRRSIGPFQATVTVEEIGADELEITQHPVQQGAAISDHAFMLPARLALSVLFDDRQESLVEIYAKFLKLQADRLPIDVITGKRFYRNMLIKSLGQTTDAETENILSLSLDLQEIFIVAVEAAKTAPRERQAEAGRTGAVENAGRKTAQPINAAGAVQTGAGSGAGANKSALRSLAG